MAKSPTDWNDSEIKFMSGYSKELEEETLAETSYSAAVKQSLRIAIDGRI